MKARMLKKFIAPVLLLSTITTVGIGVVNTTKIVAQARDWDDYDDWYDDDRYEDFYDKVEYRGNISITNMTTHKGTIGVIIPIPNGIKVDDVDIDFEPHNGIEETVLGKNIVIYGLRPGTTYNNLMLTIEGFNDVEYKFNITPFTTPGISEGSNGIVVNKPIFPQVPSNPGLIPNNKPETFLEIQQYLERVYDNIFNRKVDKGGLDYWTSKLSSKDIDLEEFFKNLLIEPEFNQVAPTVEDKIIKIYEGVFQRKPDEEGFKFWVERYRQELIDEGNEREALEEIIDQMTDGKEFREINYKLGLL